MTDARQSLPVRREARRDDASPCLATHCSAWLGMPMHGTGGGPRLGPPLLRFNELSARSLGLVDLRDGSRIAPWRLVKLSGPPHLRYAVYVRSLCERSARQCTARLSPARLGPPRRCRAMHGMAMLCGALRSVARRRSAMRCNAPRGLATRRVAMLGSAWEAAAGCGRLICVGPLPCYDAAAMRSRAWHRNAPQCDAWLGIATPSDA